MRHQMQPFPDADPEVHTIFGGEALRQMCDRAPGEISLGCYECNSLVCENIDPSRLVGFVYKCAICGAHNIMPTEFDAASKQSGGSIQSLPNSVVGVLARAPVEIVGKDLSDAIEWMRKFGFNVDPTRVAQYLRIIDRATSGDIGASSDEYSVAFFESADFISIFSAFADGRYDGLIRERLRRVCGGPIRLSDEASEASRAARDFAFELSLAAKLVCGGLELDPSTNADIALRIDGRRVLIEAKRPGREQACGRRIKEASRQLERRYLEELPNENRGIVALDLTRVLSFDHATSMKSSIEKINIVVADSQRAFVQRHAQLLKSFNGTKTLGLLLRVRALLPRIEGERGLVNVNREYFHPAPTLRARDYQTLRELEWAFRTSLRNRIPSERIFAFEERGR